MATFWLVLAAVFPLVVGKRLELLAIVAPVSILVAVLAARDVETASVEWRRKR